MVLSYTEICGLQKTDDDSYTNTVCSLCSGSVVCEISVKVN